MDTKYTRYSRRVLFVITVREELTVEAGGKVNTSTAPSILQSEGLCGVIRLPTHPWLESYHGQEPPISPRRHGSVGDAAIRAEQHLFGVECFL